MAENLKDSTVNQDVETEQTAELQEKEEQTTQATESKSRALTKKIFKITGNVLLYVFIAFCVLMVISTIFLKKNDDGAMTLFNHQARLVVSESMERCDETDVSGYAIKDIPVKSLIFVELKPEDEAELDKWYSELKVGDVLTFKYVYLRQETITHRIVSITEKPTGGYIINLEGDNKSSNASTLKQTIDTSQTESSNYVIGKVVGQSRVLGWLVYSVRQPLGIVLVVIVPCLIIIILEVVKIVGVLQAGKKEKIKKEKQEKESEIERLKKELEDLKAKSR